MFDGSFLCLVDLKDSCRNFVRCLKPLLYICAESAKITVSCLILFFHSCENTLNTEKNKKRSKEGILIFFISFSLGF